MIVAVGRFTPTDVTPGDSTAPWEAFGFDREADLRAWFDDAGLWYPEATVYLSRAEFDESPHRHLTVQTPALR